MPMILVGGKPIRVSAAEYVIAIMPKGQRVQYHVRTNLGSFARGTGVFDFSVMYDGVTGIVKDGKKTVHVHAALGDRLKRLKMETA